MLIEKLATQRNIDSRLLENKRGNFALFILTSRGTLQ